MQVDPLRTGLVFTGPVLPAAGPTPAAPVDELGPPRDVARSSVPAPSTADSSAPSGLIEGTFRVARRMVASLLGPTPGVTVEAQDAAPPGRSQPEPVPPRPELDQVELGAGLLQLSHIYEAGARAQTLSAPQALELLRSGQAVKLEGNEVRSLEEAAFYLYLKGLGSEQKLSFPGLARSFKFVVDQKIRDSSWEVQPYKAVQYYRQLSSNPSATVPLACECESGYSSKVRLELGNYSRAQLESEKGLQGLVDRKSGATRLASACRDSYLRRLWERINDPALPHKELSMVERASLAVAAHHFEDSAGLLYGRLVEMSQSEPVEALVERVGKISGVKQPVQVVRALEFLEQLPRDLYLHSLEEVKDPEEAARVTRLRQDPELDRSFVALAGTVLREEVQRGLFRAWADHAGKVDVTPLTERRAIFDIAPHYLEMWRQVPLEQHAMFQRLPMVEKVSFDTLKAAFASLHLDESRLSAWQQCYEALAGQEGETQAALRSTWVLEHLPPGPVTPGDAHDLARVLAAVPDQQPSWEAWREVAASPPRDLVMALFHAQGAAPREQVDDLARVGLSQPDRAVALRRLTEASIPLEAALDAITALSPRAGQERSLPAMAGDYIQVREFVTGSNPDARCREAFRQALALGAGGSESLAVATGATRRLPSALELLPELEGGGSLRRQDRLADAQLGGALAARDSGGPGRALALARLLLQGEVGPEGRQALEALTIRDGPLLTQVEDWLGRSAPPENSGLTRIGHGADLLRKSREVEPAGQELARRLAGAFGGEWKQEALTLARLAPHAEEVVRELGIPQALRDAAPLLGDLLERAESPDQALAAWQQFSPAVSSETLEDRCRLARGWLAEMGELKAAGESWSRLTARTGQPDRLEDLLGAGLKLRSALSVWGEEHWLPTVDRLLAMQRREQAPNSFVETADAFVSVLARMQQRSALRGLSLESVLREVATPGSELPAWGVREEESHVTLGPVRLRKRAP